MLHFICCITRESRHADPGLGSGTGWRRPASGLPALPVRAVGRGRCAPLPELGAAFLPGDPPAGRTTVTWVLPAALPVRVCGLPRADGGCQGPGESACVLSVSFCPPFVVWGTFTSHQGGRSHNGEFQVYFWVISAGVACCCVGLLIQFSILCCLKCTNSFVTFFFFNLRRFQDLVFINKDLGNVECYLIVLAALYNCEKNTDLSNRLRK